MLINFQSLIRRFNTGNNETSIFSETLILLFIPLLTKNLFTKFIKILVKLIQA